MTEILSLRCHLNHCFLLRSIIAFPNGSSCPAHIPVPYIVAYAHATCLPDAPVLYDLSHRGRYPRPRCPIWIPPLSILQDFRGRWTEIHASERSSGGWRRAFVTGLSQAFHASRMLVEMPCFVFEF